MSFNYLLNEDYNAEWRNWNLQCTTVKQLYKFMFFNLLTTADLYIWVSVGVNEPANGVLIKIFIVSYKSSSCNIDIHYSKIKIKIKYFSHWKILDKNCDALWDFSAFLCQSFQVYKTWLNSLVSTDQRNIFLYFFIEVILVFV